MLLAKLKEECQENFKINSILIHEYQHKSTQVNTNQHKSNASQHKSTQVQNRSRSDSSQFLRPIKS